MTFTGTPVVRINGTAVTVASLPPIQDAIGQRSKMSFVVIDTTGALAIAEYQSITITDAVGTMIFSGFVQDATFSRIAYAPATYGWQVRCIDNVYLADKRIVAATYTNQTCGAIVRDIITNYLAAEGVIYANGANMYSAQVSDLQTADVSGFAKFTGGAGRIAQDTSQAWSGFASLKCVFDGSAGFQYVNPQLQAASYTAALQYTASFYIKSDASNAGKTLRYFVDSSGGAASSVSTLTLSTSWTRYTVTFTAANPITFTWAGLRLDTGGTEAVTFWIDGIQMEQAASASAWTLGGAATVQNGPTLTGWPIDYQSASSQLDKLSQIAGFYWNIDANRVLWFTAYNTTPAPFVFDGTQGDDGTGNDLIALQYKSPLYRNGQYVLGITETTSTQTETRKGDGTTTTFLMSYPLHAVPTITVNGTSKTVGISGVDSGKDWYWNKGSNVISQDSSGVKLISTDTLQVVYVGEYKTLVYSQDDGQVSTQQSLEGGSTTGKVQAVVTDTTITTSNQGFQVASSLLAKYATSGKVLTFKTLTGGLAAGQLLTVNMPSAPWKLSNVDFLIESVQWLYDGFQWWADVKALDGPVNDTWVNFFKRIAATVGVVDTTSSGVSQTVTLLQTVSESWTWTESVSETVYACPVFPWTWPVTLC